MGIPGLTSYIAKYSNDFLRDYKLCDRPLVIDGHSILHKLYMASGCNYSFGGDYSKFTYVVTKFFSILLLCNVSPIIIFDGGWDDKKVCTIYSRLKENIKTASDPKLLKKQIILPMLAKDVFKFIAREKNIPLFQTIHEADDHIAGMARSLQCPVLSSDSDFYIYNVEYIPFESLKTYVTVPTGKENNYILCRIFKTEHWHSRFPEMNIRNLPLIAVLLGNDDIDPVIFEKFFQALKVPKVLVQEFSESNKSHLKIEATLRWLQTLSINSAVFNLMKKIKREKHDSLKQDIEKIMNGYILYPTAVDDILRRLPEKIKSLVVPVVVQPYNFRDLECREDFDLDPTNQDETYLADYLRFRNAVSTEECTRISAPIINRDPLPGWFYDRYIKAAIPCHFINILLRQTLMFGTCIEDFTLPPPIKSSFKIIGVIFKLLNSRRNNHGDDLKYISRGEGSEYREVFMKTMPPANYTFPCEIPSLEELDGLDFFMKKQILSTVLNVNDQDLRPFPRSWRLYIACMKYWKYESKQTVTQCHVYALVMSMISNIVQKYYAYPAKEDEIRISQEIPDYPHQTSGVSILDLLRNLGVDECIKADKKLLTRANTFYHREADRRVLHIFSTFQNCLKNIKYLNALLNFPYSEDINEAEFFNGVLIYNFYHEFVNFLRDWRDPDAYAEDIFSESPSVLKLYLLMVSDILDLLQ